MRLSRRPEPFDSDQFIYELKIDGFRALAHINAGQSELVSRNGNTFRGFAELARWIAQNLRVEDAVVDGEIACVDESGRPVFRDLLFKRRQCVFIAFDLLFLNGKDLRVQPLLERKRALKKLIKSGRSRILYLDHVEGDGRLLFEQIVRMDLEGIVCKRKDSPYKVTEKPSRYCLHGLFTVLEFCGMKPLASGKEGRNLSVVVGHMHVNFSLDASGAEKQIERERKEYAAFKSERSER